MLLTLYTCLFWLTISGLQPVQAQNYKVLKKLQNSYLDLRLAPRNIDFAFNLFQHLVELAPNDNVIFSPISISLTLSMISLGADTRTTGKQILQGLGFDTREISEEKIHQGFQHLYIYFKHLEMLMGNTLFFQHKAKLKASSSDYLTHYYGLENVVLDFTDWDRASNQINDYISNKTHGEISDLFSDKNDPSILTLINYIFFTGWWKKPFNPEEIREGNFYGKHLNVMKVPLMYQVNDFKLLHDPLLSCTVLQMDYAGHSTFYFILADLEDLDKIIQALSQDALQRWSMSSTNRHLGVYIPKFSISGTYDLMAIMKSMGITELKKKKTNLASLTRSAKLKLSKVLHKAKLKVNEYGLLQGNSTYNTAPKTSRPTIIRIDQPFIFMILENISQSILFLGKVMTPE